MKKCVEKEQERQTIRRPRQSVRTVHKTNLASESLQPLLVFWPLKYGEGRRKGGGAHKLDVVRFGGAQPKAAAADRMLNQPWAEYLSGIFCARAVLCVCRRALPSRRLQKKLENFKTTLFHHDLFDLHLRRAAARCAHSECNVEPFNRTGGHRSQRVVA